ncbi:molybdopterin-guanine dinucleotide biosynthesis protein B [Viridibacterium curvum]|uniref:Molybdopterin-guanine dinucleotide biosynthesis protein B n=1 Tax=Viridibacterium curvum TaxID=1101404 RepID=A0ABP9Q8P5_9RHOO
MTRSEGQAARTGAPAFGFAGYSGSGKTTLIERLIPIFSGAGLQVSLIKHTHHGFDIDRPGKDSFRLREAGASQVMLAGEKRWALMTELRNLPQPTLAELKAQLAPCDLVLVEGFKSADLPKIEVCRPSLGHPFVHSSFPGVVAVASNEPVDCGLPCLDLDDPLAIAEFVLRFLDIPAQLAGVVA